MEITGIDAVTLDFSDEVHVLVSPAIASDVRVDGVARQYALNAIAEGKQTERLVLPDATFKQLAGY